MRLIKRGKYKTIEMCCGTCESEWELRKNDILASYTFGHGYYFYFYCSECDSKVIIKEEDVPSEWRHEILMKDFSYKREWEEDSF